ncbi:MAG: hypothetical protein C0406_00195 [Sideroxydans sp.]|nr:hypothetical protein [Sideroxydans sp.]TNC99529.1 MAG: hypothetical protein FD121_265 [Gallionellaceae bacterium]
MQTDMHNTDNPKRLFRLQKLWMRLFAIAQGQSIGMNEALDILVTRATTLSNDDVSDLRQMINQSAQPASESIHWKQIVSGGGGPGTGKRK